MIGIYNATNICAAISAGQYFGITNETIKTAIENYIPTNNRSQIIERENCKIILDAYNANPSSMQAALTNFFQLENEKKIAVLGDMFELGSESSEEHQKVVNYCLAQPLVEFYFVGKAFFDHQLNSTHIHFFETFEDLIPSIANIQSKDQLILIKGSRGMKLERVLDLI